MLKKKNQWTSRCQKFWLIPYMLKYITTWNPFKLLCHSNTGKYAITYLVFCICNQINGQFVQICFHKLCLHSLGFNALHKRHRIKNHEKSWMMRNTSHNKASVAPFRVKLFSANNSLVDNYSPMKWMRPTGKEVATEIQERLHTQNCTQTAVYDLKINKLALAKPESSHWDKRHVHKLHIQYIKICCIIRHLQALGLFSGFKESTQTRGPFI